jgi:hypothetical protein
MVTRNRVDFAAFVSLIAKLLFFRTSERRHFSNERPSPRRRFRPITVFITLQQRFQNFYTLRPPQDFALIYASLTQGVTGLTNIRLCTAATLLGTADKQKKKCVSKFCDHTVSTKTLN